MDVPSHYNMHIRTGCLWVTVAVILKAKTGAVDKKDCLVIVINLPRVIASLNTVTHSSLFYPANQCKVMYGHPVVVFSFIAGATGTT